MLNKDLTIIINSCDAYSDVAQLFMDSLEIHWPDNPFDVIINNETNTSKISKKSISTKDQWGKRLKILLESVKSEFVLIVFDDYVLNSFVNTDKILDRLSFIKNDKHISVVYLNTACVNDHEEDESREIRLLKKNCDYRLNSVPGIWRKKDLIGFTKNQDTPWSWEVFGSYRTFNSGKKFFSSGALKHNLFPYPYEKGGAIYRGRWVEEVINDLNKKLNKHIDPTIRGFAKKEEKVKRTLYWKLKFFWLGLNTTGIKAFLFLFRSIKRKYSIHGNR